MRRGLLIAGALLVAWRGVAAQADTGPPRPPAPGADSTVVQTPDSLARDTLERYLPAFAAAIAPGPLARGFRSSYDVDSLVFSNITTLGDLLAHIPGVYVARGGWFGAAEIAVYGGHGPLGLELYWDGLPYLPLGRDSVWLDPARVPIAPLERIDIEVRASMLRVYLVSARPRSTVPRTEVRISTGGNSIAQYRGGFSKRWRSGLGLSLSADYRNIDGITGTSTTAFNSTDLWLKAEYVPSARFGISYQIVSSAWNRAAEGTLVDGWKQRRTDGILRAFVALRDDGLGPRLGLTVARSQASKDSLVQDRSLYQAILDLSETRSRASAGVTVRVQDAARPFQVEARAAWQPLPFMSIAANARRAHYGDKGHGNRAQVSGGLQLPLGLSARGEVSWFEDFQAPVVRSDTFQRATDFAAFVRWDLLRGRVTLEAGEIRRDPFQPSDFAAGIRPVASLGPLPHSTYATAFVALRPLSGLQLSGWYFDPITGGGDFEPPTHGRVSIAFYSKFWRVYKSGVFALRGEVAAESWSGSNLGGRDSTGAQVPMRPATFVETNIEMRIAEFTAYWMTRNYNGMRGSYVTGLGYPKHAQYYGVQWFFRN
ncbi:MAG TPA: hypothetical protein VH833_08360 [Gemmatimonadales bacterium]